MRAAPAFELSLGLNAAERSLLALLAAVLAAALAGWIGSYVEAAAGTTQRGAWRWVALVLVAAALGAGIGWRAARSKPSTLRWHQGRWTWTDSGVEHEGTVLPMLDLGTWLLLTLRSQQGALRWATVGRQRAGTAWHPLRATLFAPGRIAFDRESIEPGAGGSTPR
jgi:MFS family permease